MQSDRDERTGTGTAADGAAAHLRAYPAAGTTGCQPDRRAGRQRGNWGYRYNNGRATADVLCAGGGLAWSRGVPTAHDDCAHHGSGSLNVSTPPLGEQAHLGTGLLASLDRFIS